MFGRTSLTRAVIKAAVSLETAVGGASLLLDGWCCGEKWDTSQDSKISGLSSRDKQF